MNTDKTLRYVIIYLIRSIAKSSNKPVGIAVVSGICKSVQDINSTSSSITVVINIHTLCLAQTKSSLLHHEVSRNPYCVAADEDIKSTHEGTLAATERQLIGEDIEDPGRWDLYSARNESIQGPTTNCKVDAVKVVALVDVIVVHSPTHGEEEYNPPISLADGPRVE